IGAWTEAQTGNPGTKDSGKAMNLAPAAAASAMRAVALATVACASRNTGATCAAQTFTIGYDAMLSRQLVGWSAARQATRRLPIPRPLTPPFSTDRGGSACS